MFGTSKLQNARIFVKQVTLRSVAKHRTRQIRTQAASSASKQHHQCAHRNISFYNQFIILSQIYSRNSFQQSPFVPFCSAVCIERSMRHLRPYCSLCKARCTMTRVPLSVAIKNVNHSSEHISSFTTVQLRCRSEDSAKQHLLSQKYFRYGVTLEYSAMLAAMTTERCDTHQGYECKGRFLCCQKAGLVVSRPTLRDSVTTF